MIAHTQSTASEPNETLHQSSPQPYLVGEVAVSTEARAAQELIRRQSLSLALLNVVLFTDGVPDVASGARSGDTKDLYPKIDVAPLEHLSNNITDNVDFRLRAGGIM